MSNKENKSFIEMMKNELQQRDNPKDLKSSIVGKVVQLNPIVVRIEDGLVLLTENEELEISEWFRFRCNINKENALSEDVPSDCNNAKAVTETHSYTGTPCQMPNAISYLASAIIKVKNELLALKCVLAVGDYVTVASLEEIDKYILLDKVL